MLKNYKQNKITSNGTRIISSSLLMLFLFSFLLPVGTILAADPTITISANKTEMKIGESIEIQVEVSHTPSVNITLTSNPADATLSRLEKTSLGTITVHITSTYLLGQPKDLGDHPIIFQTVTDNTTYVLQASAVSLANPFAGTGTILSNTITIEVKEPDKWWYTYKTIGATGNFKGCTTPDSFSSEIKCTTSKNLIVDGTTNIIVTDCTESETKPIPLPLCLATIVPDPSPTTTEVKTELNYYPLAPLPGVGEENCKEVDGKTICVKLAPQVCETDSSGKETCRPCTADDPASECKPGLGFAGYLNAMIKIFIGICAVLAMIMIVMGGIQYMTSELVSGKAAGKEQITHAILGLLLALGAYAILNTINPNLLDVSLGKLETATIKILVGSEIDGPNPGNGNCNPTIIKPATADGIAILAKTPGAHGASCWGGANAAYAAAGYVASGGNSKVCPTSIAPGDILTIDNDNSYDTLGYHSVIFDSINSDGTWKLWSEGSSAVNMEEWNPSASYMSERLKYSWKPFKCPTGQVPQMDSINNNAICSGAGTTTSTTDTFTGVSYVDGAFYFTGAFVSTKPLPDRKYYVQNASDDTYILIDYKFNSVWSTGAKSTTLTKKDIESLKGKTVKVKVRSAGTVIGTITTTIPD